MLNVNSQPQAGYGHDDRSDHKDHQVDGEPTGNALRRFCHGPGLRKQPAFSDGPQ